MICFVAVVAVFLIGCAQPGEDEVHLLPEDFSGPVIIIFNQADGQGQRYEGDKRVYEIPESGILRTQFPPNSGSHSQQILRKQANGSREVLPLILNLPENRDSERTAVFSLESGKVYKSSSAASSGEDEIAFRFVTYLVGETASADSLGHRADVLLREQGGRAATK